MFQNNLILTKFKKYFHSKITRVEGIVKSTQKDFGFLEINGKKSYFILPSDMKKVMHGDRIIAMLHIKKKCKIAEPEILIKPFLSRFIGRIQKHNQYYSVLPDHPLLKYSIRCCSKHTLVHKFKSGDWVIAKMCSHPLKNKCGFRANLIHFITHNEDRFAPWLVTLAKYNYEKKAPEMINIDIKKTILFPCQDLTMLDFITIDSANTEDMDDALFVMESHDGSIQLTIAIADPTAYIPKDSTLDKVAMTRAFTNYLPGFNIPMLPRILSDNLCSLRPNEYRQVLACRVNIDINGTINNINFFSANIKSKAKLIYDEVSDFLEGIKGWTPPNKAIFNQINLLKRVYDIRNNWRHKYALVLQNRPDYKFILNEHGDVLKIVKEKRRIAHYIIEECMITANICSAKILHKHLGFGIYNVHTGFDPHLINQAVTMLNSNGFSVTSEQLLNLKSYCKLRRELDLYPIKFLNSRIHRFQTFSEISTTLGPHFGLGLKEYATWTSPIRKYSDMINHRLLKAIITKQSIEKPKEKILLKIIERRRLNRITERHIINWLYARYLYNQVNTNKNFSAEIIDIIHNGIRVRLIENGAIAFIPIKFIHSVRKEIFCNQKTGTVKINNTIIYRQSDNIQVNIIKIHMNSHRIIVCPSFLP